jgi:glutamine synthetase
MTVDELRAEIEAGAVDTVLVGFTDMQGRLQGKRLHARTGPRAATTCSRWTST